MTRVRSFRLYDTGFFLDKGNKFYCLSNRTRFTNNQFSLTNCFLDALNLVNPGSIAVSLSTPMSYYWGGQVSFDVKHATAWFDWLISGKNSNNSNLLELLEYFVKEAGQEGMHNCAVTLDEGNWVTSSFRQNGFGAYAKQSVWKYDGDYHDEMTEFWQLVTPVPFDEYDRFYESQITPLIRKLGSNWTQGNIYALKREGEILATAKATTDSSRKTIYLEPIFHPGAESPARLLFGLANTLIGFFQCEINVLVPGFQAWVIDSYRSEGYFPVCNQIIYVKKLTAPVADEIRMLAIEKGTLQTAGPTNIKINQEENEPLRK